jgi:hypothetical protein
VTVTRLSCRPCTVTTTMLTQEAQVGPAALTPMTSHHPYQLVVQAHTVFGQHPCHIATVSLANCQPWDDLNAHCAPKHLPPCRHSDMDDAQGRPAAPTPTTSHHPFKLTVCVCQRCVWRPHTSLQALQMIWVATCIPTPQTHIAHPHTVTSHMQAQ